MQFRERRILNAKHEGGSRIPVAALFLFCVACFYVVVQLDAC